MPFLIGAVILAVCLYIAVVAELAGKQCLSTIRDRRSRIEAISRRADQQHQQVMCGDRAGMYGDYPPPDLGEHTPYWLK